MVHAMSKRTTEEEFCLAHYITREQIVDFKVRVSSDALDMCPHISHGRAPVSSKQLPQLLEAARESAKPIP